jgi:hypothetical protein
LSAHAVLLLFLVLPNLSEVAACFCVLFAPPLEKLHIMLFRLLPAPEEEEEA